MTTVTAVVAAYNSESWIREALLAILGQTRPPEQIIVVDDGSTDHTAAELTRFGDAIQVVTQRNAGCPAAFNSAFRHASGDFVAMCGADDVWEPHKLEWQMETIAAHPDADVLFGDARIIGEHRPAGLTHDRTERPPGVGILDRRTLQRALYRGNMICAPSIVIRRRLFERLGPFVEDFGADDYEYWMRCLRAGASFYYDPRIMLSYRRHEGNLSSRLMWMAQCSHVVHRRYADLVEDRSLVRETLSVDLFKLGRGLVDHGDSRQARRAFRKSLRYRIDGRAVAWLMVQSLPPALRDRAGTALIDGRRLMGRARPAAGWRPPRQADAQERA